MLWLFYIYDAYSRMGMNSPMWTILLCLAAVLMIIIPLICTYLLIFHQGRMTKKQKWHCIIGLLFY